MKLTKTVGIVSTVTIAWTSLSVAAPCGNQAPVTGNQLVKYIEGNLVCAYKPANTNGNNANERWSSLHDGTNPGTLYEYARGANDPVDATKEVGTWELVDNSGQVPQGNGQIVAVRYTYGTNAAYTWDVRPISSASPAPYEFCDPNTNDRIAYAKTEISGVTPGTTTGNACSWPNF